jgi:AcrR family transcriptional regulator
LAPKGRRAGANQTRAAILEAARRRFAGDGYGVSLRAIAADAGVDPALPVHLFGSKDALFAAAIALPVEPERVRAEVAAGPRDGLGERLARFFLSIWDDPRRRDPIMAMLRAATTSPPAAAALRDSLAAHVFAPLAPELDEPAQLRLALCSAQLVGVGIVRYVVGVEPLASLAPERVAALVGPSLQRYLTAKM